MDQAQLLSIIGSVYDKFVADVSARVEGNLMSVIDRRVQEQIDKLSAMDKEMITDIVKGEIEDMDIDQSISDWMENNFDIDDHLDLNDKIDDYLSDRLTAMVRDEVSDLSFSVTVD